MWIVYFVHLCKFLGLYQDLLSVSIPYTNSDRKIWKVSESRCTVCINSRPIQYITLWIEWSNGSSVIIVSIIQYSFQRDMVVVRKSVFIPYILLQFYFNMITLSINHMTIFKKIEWLEAILWLKRFSRPVIVIDML